MSGDDRQAVIQWREALLWLAKAEADIAGARTLLSGDQSELAAFLVQQAVEKTLKALLVAAAQDVRRTHDIDALATLARAQWPHLLPLPFPLAVVSQWYVTTRCPGLDASPPTATEVAEALAAVAAFVSDVVRHSSPDIAASGGKDRSRADERSVPSAAPRERRGPN
jgi:HEPN domain-containing protein